MVNRNLIRDFDVSDDELEKEIWASLGAPSEEALPQLYVAQDQEFEPNKIVTGKVREIRDDEVVIDVGAVVQDHAALGETQGVRRL